MPRVDRGPRWFEVELRRGSAEERLLVPYYARIARERYPMEKKRWSISPHGSQWQVGYFTACNRRRKYSFYARAREAAEATVHLLLRASGRYWERVPTRTFNNRRRAMWQLAREALRRDSVRPPPDLLNDVEDTLLRRGRARGRRALGLSVEDVDLVLYVKRLPPDVLERALRGVERAKRELREQQGAQTTQMPRRTPQRKRPPTLPGRKALDHPLELDHASDEATRYPNIH
jgi:hypothetical protein